MAAAEYSGGDLFSWVKLFTFYRIFLEFVVFCIFPGNGPYFPGGAGENRHLGFQEIYILHEPVTFIHFDIQFWFDLLLLLLCRLA